MSAALQVFHATFDAAFLKLTQEVQSRIQNKIDDLGRRLDTFPHERLTGSTRCRLRVGDYRIIYAFNLEKGVIDLLAVGHRREIYKKR